MRPVADLTKLLRQIHATPRELALQIWTDEKQVQSMTLTFEVKRAERRYAATVGIRGMRYGTREGFR